MRRRLGRAAVRLVLLALTVWALTVAAVLWRSGEAMAAHGQGRSLGVPVDAAIVLGAGVDGDGVLGYAGRRRVAAAVGAYRAGKTRALIMTGPPVPAVDDSVAGLMRAHAIALGVPAADVLTEERSTTTFENLRFAFAVAEAAGMERLALVSDAFHLPRARALAHYLGEPDIGLVAAQGLARDGTPDRIWAVLREGLAWWYNLGKVAAWELLGALGWSAAERSAVVR